MNQPVLSHDALVEAIPAVLGAWRVDGRFASVSPVGGGTLNWNFDVRAGRDRYFLRCCRPDLETDRIVEEHRLIAWARERGIEAPAPIATPDGATLVFDASERRWVLFPWLQGACVPRGGLRPAQARALGDVHGRLQAVLAKHPASDAVARPAWRWGRTESLDLLGQLIDVAKSRNAPGWMVDGMVRQRELLELLDVAPPEQFAALPCQLLHGDFHDQQVLFDGDVVSGIVDWEIWRVDSRARELIRSLVFSRLLDSPLMEDYLAGYRAHVRLGEEEVRLALRMWFQSRVVGLWAWAAYFRDGNERVAEFFPAIIADLGRVSDARWTAAVADRLVRAANA